TDTPQSKLTIEQECRRFGKSLCSGGVKGWTGQVITVLPDTASLSQIYPEMVHQEHIDNLGVMGPTPAVIASIQASECIKFLTGEGEMLINKILIVNFLTNSYSVIDVPC
ncbi:MAG: ThiF family adenylyltransferase, partial [Muribaculaceae bacterium]|nr:ThiF family adenylyltransferase [Muribaculaceae bacterium]